MKYVTNASGSTSALMAKPACCVTIPVIDSVPATSTTATSERICGTS